MTHIYVSTLGLHWFRWWLVTCSIPSHYLNQWWITFNWSCRNKFWGNVNQNTVKHTFWIDYSLLKYKIHYLLNKLNGFWKLWHIVNLCGTVKANLIVKWHDIPILLFKGVKNIIASTHNWRDVHRLAGLILNFAPSRWEMLLQSNAFSHYNWCYPWVWALETKNS